MPDPFKSVLSILSIAAAAGIFVAFFAQIPIEGTTLAIDWQGLWQALRHGVHYDIIDGLRNPPWSVLPLLPLGWFSMRVGWGLLVFFTFVTLILSVPRSPDNKKRYWWLSVFLLSVSFPSLRHAVDGNFEGLVIVGILLALAGYERKNPYVLSAGVLMASAKPQEVVLFMVVLGVYVLQVWPRRDWLIATLVTLAVIIPTMLWQGGNWIQALAGTYQRGSIMDISLWAALNRTGWISTPVQAALWATILLATFFVAWRSSRELTREKAGMLIAASLLISPYAAGNNVLTLLAIGIMPLLQNDLMFGLPLVILTNLPYLFTRDMLYYGQAYYWTALTFLSWAVISWRIYRSDQETAQPNTEEARIQ